MTKTCYHCKKTIPLESFRKNGNTSDIDGRNSICEECSRKSCAEFHVEFEKKWASEKLHYSEIPFHSGDIVQLVAGGPRMVVKQFVSINKGYVCVWFDIGGVKHEDTFLQFMIKSAPQNTVEQARTSANSGSPK